MTPDVIWGGKSFHPPYLGEFKWMTPCLRKYAYGKNRGGREPKRRGKKLKDHNNHRPLPIRKLSDPQFYVSKFEFKSDIPHPEMGYVFLYRKCWPPVKRPRKFDYTPSASNPWLKRCRK